MKNKILAVLIIVTLLFISVVPFSNLFASKKTQDILTNDKTDKNIYDLGRDEGFDAGWDARGDYFPNIQDCDSHGLHGVDEICIYITNNDSEDYDKLFKTQIELKLRKHGIKVVDKLESPLSNGGVLCLDYKIFKNGDTDICNVSLFFVKKVIHYQYMPNKTTKFYQHFATTWGMRPGLTGTSDNGKKDVKEIIEENLDEFINDWLKENPSK